MFANVHFVFVFFFLVPSQMPSDSPTDSPTALRRECRDITTWMDNIGDVCSAYGTVCKHGTPIMDRSVYEMFADSDGSTALDACCICGGGKRKRLTKKSKLSTYIYIIIHI